MFEVSIEKNLKIKFFFLLEMDSEKSIFLHAYFLFSNH